MDSEQALVSMAWGALGAGAVLSGYGLVRSGLRYSQWKRLRAWHEGEIVPGSEALRRGLPVNMVASEAVEEASKGGLACYIAETGKKSLGLQLDMERQPSLRALGSPLPMPGASVLVAVTGGAGLLRFEARVLDVRALPSPVGQRLITISRPFWLARVQRRQHARAELNLPATFQTFPALEAETNSRMVTEEKSVHVHAALPHHGNVRDLSAGGLRAELGEALGTEETEQLLARFAPDSVVQVRLPLPLLSASPLLARVRVSERTVQRGGLGVRIACEFLPMPPSEQELLVSHVFRLNRADLQTRATNPLSS